MKIAEVILREGYELRLERDKRANMLVLHVKDTRTGRRSEVRGKLGYETDGYDPNDKLHQLLDKVGRSASVSDMMNGDVVHINPRHPQGPSAKKAASAITSENFADGKKKGIGKYLYHVTYASGLLGMLKDGHLNTKGPSGFADYFSMTADPKYVVSGNPEVQIVIDAGRVSQLETFEQHKEDWDDSGKDNGDWESEYRVEETIPWNYVVAVKILKAKATPEIIELAKKRGVKLVGKDTSVTENFADGKKKGKSRPGRVKKSGASCSGSVTSLRKKAKAGGEKGRMYHWCANMKSGRKKK